MPPLRDRMEDIPLLVGHFISRFNRTQGRDITGMTDEALACLMSHPFPGNVRELENIIERPFILCRAGEIDRGHLPDGLCPTTASAGTSRLATHRSFKQLEAAFVSSALERNGWNKLKTARELGIHKTTLFRKMRALGISGAPDPGR